MPGRKVSVPVVAGMRMHGQVKVNRRMRASWIVLGALLVSPFALAGIAPSRAQEPSGIESAVLVTSRADISAGELTAISAARLVVLEGQATVPVVTRGTVLLVLEFGRIRIETDAPLPGVARRDDGTS